MSKHDTFSEHLTLLPAAHYPPEKPVLNDILQKVRGYFHAPSVGGESPSAPSPPGEVPTVVMARKARLVPGRAERSPVSPLSPGEPPRGSPPSPLSHPDPTTRVEDPALAATVASERTGSGPPIPADEEITPDPLLQEAGRIATHPDRPTPLPDLQPGQMIGPDRFRIVKLLGQGGFGAVYEAVDVQLHRAVALKVLTHEDGSDEWRRRFRREIIAAAGLTHRNIAAVYDAGEDAGRSFVAMELVRGPSLSALLKSGLLPLEQVWQLAREIAAGLAKAHAAQIVHRDIKPGNVLVSDDGEAKLLDFGLAKRMLAPGSKSASYDKITLTHDNKVIGTPAYMSPEQARGVEVDVRSDIFSFGVVLYEMVTGARPFAGKTMFELLMAVAQEDPPLPSAVHERTPPELERIILHCLQKLPELRYAHGGELLEALLRPPAPRVAPVHPLAATMLSAPAHPRRRAAWLVPTAGAFATGALVAALSFWPRQKPGTGALTTSTTSVAGETPPAESTAIPTAGPAETAASTTATATATATATDASKATPGGSTVEPKTPTRKTLVPPKPGPTGPAPPSSGPGPAPPPPPSSSQTAAEQEPTLRMP